MRAACLICPEADIASKARALASQLSLDYLEAFEIQNLNTRDRRRFFREQFSDMDSSSMALLMDATGLSLLQEEGGEILQVQADFCNEQLLYRCKQSKSSNEMIAKAIGIKGSSKPRVLDCTAGLGVDAFVLAHLGCELTLLERVPEVHALLCDALERAQNFDNPLVSEAIQRMRLIPCANSINYVSNFSGEEHPDVIFLDPMFPARTKSALVKKEMRVLHALIGSDLDSEALLEGAKKVANKRVVVKRPKLATALASDTPDQVLLGQRNRYDIYFSG